MATIRVRVELQRASKGIEMAKLAKLSEETQKLFRMVAEDVGIGGVDGTWVAVDFYNQGIGFDAEFQLADVDQQQADSYLRAVDFVADADLSQRRRNVRDLTVVQGARVAALADSGETVRFGFLESTAVRWKPLAKDRAVSILEQFEGRVGYRGMLQGIIHSLHKESSPPFFSLRDFASGALVRCLYQQKDYAEVYRSLERREAVVLVAGWIQAKRMDRSIDEMRVERIEPTRPLSPERLKEFFGSAPGWTGDLTSDQFIDRARREGDAEE